MLRPFQRGLRGFTYIKCSFTWCTELKLKFVFNVIQLRLQKGENNRRFLIHISNICYIMCNSPHMLHAPAFKSLKRPSDFIPALRESQCMAAIFL